jgi:hypothetical protein
MWGLTVDEAMETVEVWPDNLAAVNVFICMLSQWQRVGVMNKNGVTVAKATGLKYESLPAVMDLEGIPKKERSSVFAAVRIMEEAALEKMNEQ